MSVKYKFQGTTSLAHGLARQPLSTIPAVRLAIVGTHPVVLNLISRAFTCKATPAQISASYTPDEESLARSLEDPAASTMRVLPRDSIAFMVRHIDGPAAARHTAHVFFFFFCAFFFLFCPVCAASGNTGNGGARAHAALCQARLVSDRPAVARGRRPVLMTKWAELMTRSSAVKPRCLCARPARQRTPIRRRRSSGAHAERSLRHSLRAPVGRANSWNTATLHRRTDRETPETSTASARRTCPPASVRLALLLRRLRRGAVRRRTN